MDSFLNLQKLNKKGKRVSHQWAKMLNPVVNVIPKFLYNCQFKLINLLFYSGPNSRLRVSHRQLDSQKSTESEPYHTHKTSEPLKLGQYCLMGMLP